jgi:hypothetical protein
MHLVLDVMTIFIISAVLDVITQLVLTVLHILRLLVVVGVETHKNVLVEMLATLVKIVQTSIMGPVLQHHLPVPLKLPAQVQRFRLPLPKQAQHRSLLQELHQIHRHQLLLHL